MDLNVGFPEIDKCGLLEKERQVVNLSKEI